MHTTAGYDLQMRPATFRLLAQGERGNSSAGANGRQIQHYDLLNPGFHNASEQLFGIRS
jgi:hypothetical protein